jgi:hypothetical protein
MKIMKVMATNCWLQQQKNHGDDKDHRITRSSDDKNLLVVAIEKP